jgi:hypothetical protein
MKLRKKLILAMIAGLCCIAAAASAEGDDERIDRLEGEVAELKAAIAELKAMGLAEDRLAEVERRLGLLAEEIEDFKIGEAAVAAPTAGDGEPYGLGPAAAKVYQKDGGVSVGGYGEALLQLYDDEKDDGSAGGKVDQFDFLRAVLYVGYKFSDSWVLNTEIEFEHASTSDGGSVSVEFAYLDYLWRDEFNVRAGLVLLPMGWLNELHEPTVYLGATRPMTEQVIIPTTWRENGVGAWGEIGAFDYRTYVVNGLDAAGFSAQGLRGGRQKGARAKAEDFAWVGRLDFTGVPGLIVGASGYLGDSGQDLEDAAGQAVPVGTTIVELHAEYRYRGLKLRGLYSQATLDDVVQLNRALGFSGAQSVGERLDGGYLEAGFDLLAGRDRSSLIPYVRWERLNTQEEVPEGWSANPANDQELLTLGLAYQPLPQLIFKAEYLNVDNRAGTGIDQFNLALGYIF